MHYYKNIFFNISNTFAWARSILSCSLTHVVRSIVDDVISAFWLAVNFRSFLLSLYRFCIHISNTTAVKIFFFKKKMVIIHAAIAFAVYCLADINSHYLESLGFWSASLYLGLCIYIAHCVQYCKYNNSS